MKTRLLYLILIYLLAFPLPAQHHIPDFVAIEQRQAQALRQFQASPHTGDYDLTHTALYLRVDPRLDTINGYAEHRFTALTSMTDIYFDMDAALTADSVIYHQTHLSFSQSNGQIRITLPSSLAAGSTDLLRIYYHGNPASTGFGSFETSVHNQVPILWTLSEPYGAMGWWPTKQDLIDKIDSIDITIDYPALIDGHAMQGVSNGLVAHDTIINGRRITRWHHGHPIPAYLVAIAVTDYARFDLQAGIFQSFPVQNYVYPEDSARAAGQLPVIVDIMDYYESVFGQYPFSDEKYGHAQFGWGGGMEHTTITFVGGFSRGLIAHELAHHWFGDNITCASWPDIWINEGFATYSEALTQEYLDGQAAFEGWRRYAIRGITRRPHGGVYKHGADTLNIGELFSWYNTYLKGAMVLHMLRFRLGDSTFFDGLRNFLQNYSYDFASTEDFRQIMEQTSGSDLQEFFNDWVYGKGFPDYRVNWQQISSGVYNVSLKQNPTDNSVDFFETPLRIRLTGDSSQVYDTIVFHDHNNQSFVLTPGFDATGIEINPGANILIGQTEYLRSPAYRWTADLLQFPNPIGDSWQVWIREPARFHRMYLADMTGKIILDGLRPFREIHTGFLPAGTYLLVVETDDKVLTEKLIKP